MNPCTKTNGVLYIEMAWTYLQIFTWIIIFFDGAFEYGGISKFLGYVGTNAELLGVEFCNFGQCYIFARYLSFIVKFDITSQLVLCGIILKPQFHFMFFFYERCFEYRLYQRGGRKALEII
jgi:hypothetical protein